MPALNRAPEPAELRRLIQLFLRAETDIINEIARLRARGLADYHAEAALERVQTILLRLSNECWSYAPKMIERQFYFKHPEDRKPLPVPETAEKHGLGYANAAALTSTQTDIVQRLVMNLMGEIEASAAMAAATLQSALLGRVELDVFRRVGLEQAAAMQAQGAGAYKALPRFVEALRREGVTAFIDKAGRRWSLHAYGAMVLRTTSRQAEVLAVLTADEGQDLYKISAHGTTCKLCAPLEGRVYSRSGTDPDFPPLAAAFGKVDPSGPDTLANSWLNIHSTETILDFILKNNVAAKNGKSLYVGAVRWCKGAGTGGSDRMVIYVNHERFLQVEELVPLSRALSQPNAAHFCYDTAYAANLSEVELFYPQTMMYFDGI